MKKLNHLSIFLSTLFLPLIFFSVILLSVSMLSLPLLSISSLSVFGYDCTELIDGDNINGNIVLCESEYSLTDSLKISDDATLDCNNAIIKGNDVIDGLIIKENKNIVVKNCKFSNFLSGISVLDSENIEITENTIENNINGVSVSTSKEIKVNKNNIKSNSVVALHFTNCVNCEHTGNTLEDNANAMKIEYTCYTGDGVCPSSCTPSNDNDCQTQNQNQSQTQPTDPSIENDNNDLTTITGAVIGVPDETTSDNTAGADTAAEADSEPQKAEDTIDFNLIAENDELLQEAEVQPQSNVVYPIVETDDNSLTTPVLTALGFNAEKHFEILEDVELTMKRSVYEDRTVIEITILPKTYFTLLEFYEYFPKDILADASQLSSNVPFTAVKNLQAAKVKLTNIKKGSENIISFTIDKQLPKKQKTYTVFAKAYPKKDWLFNLLFVLVVLLFIDYLFSVRSTLKTYSMYLHGHMNERYMIITNKAYTYWFYLVPFVMLVSFIFEASIKAQIGLWVFRIFSVIIFVCYLTMMIAVSVDIMTFKKRYSLHTRTPKHKQ
ncbi:right-handed parallel beta-helix repeat-containing protein [Candidatus Woesearchaeota archaeon]|nr:right-handed parallel beta-helix repeat-containing protein [Candidatus Woesearchaeota archaeon]